MTASLTFRQERFALEYLKDQNASAAAARAGYTARNMAAQGHELLNNPAIRDRVRAEMEAMLAEIRCSVMALMKQRMKAAFFDAGKLFKAGWELLAPDELDAETRATVEVSSVTRKSGPVVRMKQPDRHRALRALEKVHERLDRLNEAHYRALEKAGKLKSLAEIEAMDGGGMAAAGALPMANAEKDQVLSGGRCAAAPRKPEKDQVLSGAAGDASVLPPGTPGMDRAISGARPSPGPGRMVLGRAIAEKHQVLSGPQWRLSPLAAALRGLGQPPLAA